MTSRLWLNLALLLLVGLLILVVIYEPGKQAPTQAEKLTLLSPEQITHIRITRNNDVDIELQKSDEQWWMIAPYHLPANEFRIQSLLRLAQIESSDYHELDNLKLETYGLDNPLASITFNHNVRINFGNTAPLGQRRYLQVGNRLHTLGDTFYYQAAGRPIIYLNHALLPPHVEIKKLILPDLELSLQEGTWHVTPEHPDLSADAFVDLINNWHHAQAISLNPVKKQTVAADIEIYITSQAQPLQFKLNKSEESTTLTRLDIGIEYVIASDVLEQILSLPRPESASR